MLVYFALGDASFSRFYPTRNLKPIFHQNAKYLASRVGVGQCTRRQIFALPNAKYTNMLVYFGVTPDAQSPTPTLKFALPPTPTPDASQWNIAGVGSQRKKLALAMYISFFLCRFHLRLYPTRTQFPVEYGLKSYVCPDAKPQRQPVEYRLRWVPGVGSWRWACTFHVFCVDFICVGHPTQTRFLVEYGLKLSKPDKEY